MSNDDCQATEWCPKDWIDAHPEEPIHIRSLLPVIWFVFFFLVGFSFWTKDSYTGYPYSILSSEGVSGLFLLEVCALFATFGVAVAYTREIRRETRPNGAMRGEDAGTYLLSIGLWSAINCVVIIISLILLCAYEYFNRLYWVLYAGYLCSTCIIFLIFMRLDFVTMHKGTKRDVCKTYWALFAFCDGPAAFSFVLLNIYLGFYLWRSPGITAEIIPTSIIGGAVAMQLMIADAIYLIIASNLCFWLYKNYACKNLTE